VIVKNRNSRKRKVFTIILVIAWLSFAGFSAYYVYTHFIDVKPEVITRVDPNGVEIKVDERPVTVQAKQEWTVPASHPRYISIPKLGIENARIVQLGIIKKTGQLDAPVSIHDAGWYNGSALPGKGGAMLMDGHNGGPNFGGIFEKLRELKNGDEIIIERGDGKKLTYVVKDNRDMNVKDINDPSNKWGMATMTNSIEAGKEGLNIITCVGQWDERSQTFNERTMLRAVIK
jgi:lipoprotein